MVCAIKRLLPLDQLGPIEKYVQIARTHGASFGGYDPLTIASESVMKGVALARELNLEQRDRRPRGEPGTFAHIHRHDGLIGGVIQKLFSVAAPSRLNAARRRDPLLAPSVWKIGDVDFPGAGFVRRVGDPMRIARELRLTRPNIGGEKRVPVVLSEAGII